MPGVVLIERPIGVPSAALISRIIDGPGSKGNPQVFAEKRLGEGQYTSVS
jgi:hypothetical protein